MKGNIVILDKIQFIYSKSMCSLLYLDECFQVFALFDADGGGTIGPDELECAMTALGFQNYGGGRSLAGSPAFAASVNGEEGQEITLDVFTSLMKGELSGQDPLEELKCIFGLLSKQNVAGDSAADHSQGEISKVQLQNACKEFNLRLTDHELDLMLDSVDANNNQSVDEKEFLAVMSHSAWF